MGVSPTKRMCILKDSYGRVVIRLVIPRVAKLGLIWRRNSRINARDTKSSACCQFRKTSASEFCQKHSSLLGIRPCLPKLLTHQVMLLANFHVRELDIALRLEHDHEIRASKLEVRDLFPLPQPFPNFSRDNDRRDLRHSDWQDSEIANGNFQHD